MLNIKTKLIDIKKNYWDREFIKKINKIIIPIVILSIIDSLTGIIDQSMIGIFQEKGSSELAASTLGLRYSFIAMLILKSCVSVFSWMIMQYKGKKDFERIESVYKTIHLIIFILGGLFILLAYVQDDTIMRIFQGKNYGDASTQSGLAQSYMKVQVLTIIPVVLVTFTIPWLVANKKQKVIIPFSLGILFFNVFGNFIFYKIFHLGINGIAFSTLTAEILLVLGVFFYMYKSNIGKGFFYNPLKIFAIHGNILKLGLKKILVGTERLLLGSVIYGVSIIYSRWYGDLANNQLGIVEPLISTFTFAFFAVSSTKSYFVANYIGKSNKDQALLNDKKINTYGLFIAVIESFSLTALSFVLPLIWVNASTSTKFNASLILIGVAVIYPFLAMSKLLVRSLAISGMGKTIFFSQGIYILIFEFLFILALYLINVHLVKINIKFWQLFWIAQLLQVIKLVPTYLAWKKKKWLETAV